MLDANKILQVYKDKGYKYDVGEEVFNICYLEGVDPDGIVNRHTPNYFDDLRVVWQALEDGTTKVVGAWEATTRPSTYWTRHPMNPSGAFIIALGQQTCWTMGQYHDQIALIQTQPIHGTRDYNQDYERRGDREYPAGLYGVHHHWGYNYPHDDAGRSSAGCQVGRTKQGHEQFIQILKTDKRYVSDHNHLWTSTVLTADEYSNAKPKMVSAIVAGGSIIAGTVIGGYLPYHPLSIIAPVGICGALGGLLYWLYRHRKAPVRDAK